MSLNTINISYSVLGPSLQKIMIKKNIVEKKLKNYEKKDIDFKNNIFTNKENLEKSHLKNVKHKIDRALYRIWLDRVLKKTKSIHSDKSLINNLYKKNIEMMKNIDLLNFSIIDMYV